MLSRGDTYDLPANQEPALEPGAVEVLGGWGEYEIERKSL
jgi:hypothetical protein